MAFYEYRQNNSAGVFVYTEDLGETVFIEASSPTEADDRLRQLGGYFGGVAQGLDCECCGDRWDSQEDLFEGYSYPDEKELRERVLDRFIRQAVIHFADGRREWVNRGRRF